MDGDMSVAIVLTIVLLSAMAICFASGIAAICLQHRIGRLLASRPNRDVWDEILLKSASWTWTGLPNAHRAYRYASRRRFEDFAAPELSRAVIWHGRTVAICAGRWLAILARFLVSGLLLADDRAPRVRPEAATASAPASTDPARPA
jgi:hypothetical protein